MQKSMTRKVILSLLLISMIAAPVMTACGNETPSDDTSAPNNTDSTNTEDDIFEKDSLPDDLDFNKATVNILWWEENKEFVDQQTGDVVDDALYQRDRNVEDRLNVTINNIGRSYTWETRNEYLGAIRSSVMSGDNEYDIVSGQAATMPSLISDGIFLNLMELKYLDFSKPWWVNGITDETAVDGKLYLATGDITKQTIGTVCCMFGNQRMFDDFQLENPVDLVWEGKWTIDKVKELASGVYQDINNDSSYGTEDRYGVVIYNENGITAFQQSFGIQVTTLNKNGYPELTINTERTDSAMAKLNDYLKGTEDFYLGKGAELQSNYAIFSEGRALLTTGFFKQAAEVYNNMTDDFWILPYPKFNEEQEEYHTRLGEANTLFGITSGCKDTDMAAAVMEAMSSESYRTVAPAYYEVALKVKYSRNDESAKMFDFIRSSVVFDFGALYGGAIGLGGLESIKNFFWTNNEWASYYASREEKAKANIESFVEMIKGLD